MPRQLGMAYEDNLAYLPVGQRLYMFVRCHSYNSRN